MSANILCLIPVGTDGSLDRVSLECLGAAKQLKTQLQGQLVVGCIGKVPSLGIGSVGAEQYLCVEGDAFQSPRYATDVAAGEALVKACDPALVLAPSSSRMLRFMSGLAMRCGGAVDTHVTGLDVQDGVVVASRWFYRQRIETKISRKDAKPWCLTVESGVFAAIDQGETATFTALEIGTVESRTVTVEVETTSGGDQTIRPDSDLLFVAGAGWTKKQSDGNVRTDVAASLILDFVTKRKASLGSSKSMVDLSAEGQAVLPFLTHLHQIGQTGATPRHNKGLATCCHGEEPHAVGWRFIKERRAINTDGNCGWAHGKADVLYVADAFEVMEKVNAML